MALAVSLGPGSVRHTGLATSPAAAAGGTNGCCGSGAGGCSGLIASPSTVSLVTLPQRVYRRRKSLAGRGETLSSPSTSRNINPSSKSCATRRVLGSAERETLRTVDVNEDDLDQKSVFRPPLGWPVSAAAAPEFQLLNKSTNGSVRLQVAPILLDKDLDGDAASEELDGSDRPPSGDLYRQWWIATEFSAAVQSGSPPPRQKEEKSERDNYYLNTGYAIRMLREELPHLFYRKLSFDIYRNDITFRDPMNTFSGIDNYKLIFWALRFHGRIFFKSIWVEILRVWQPHDKVIMIRWTVRGVPRVPWEAQGRFDGTSEYKLDSEGKIYEHKVDNVIFNSPPSQRFKAISVLDLVAVKGGGQTNPTPSFFSQFAMLMDRLFPYIRQFTWIRFYWALSSTLALNNAGDYCGALGSDA